MKALTNLLSAEQQRSFDGFVKTWQARLGLMGWRIERSRKVTKAMSDVTMDHKSLLAVYRIGDFGSTAITSESIEGTAIHELLHVLLFRLVNQVEIGLTDVALESEEHNVIHVLEKLLTPPLPTPQ